MLKAHLLLGRSYKELGVRHLSPRKEKQECLQFPRNAAENNVLRKLRERRCHTASIELLLRGGGRRFPSITLEELLRPSYSREVDSGRNPLRVVAPPNDSPESGWGKSLSRKWFGRLTLGEVVRGNYSPGGGSAELLSRRWFRGNYSREVAWPNYSREGGSEEITPREVVRPN